MLVSDSQHTEKLHSTLTRRSLGTINSTSNIKPVTNLLMVTSPKGDRF